MCLMSRNRSPCERRNKWGAVFVHLSSLSTTLTQHDTQNTHNIQHNVTKRRCTSPPPRMVLSPIHLHHHYHLNHISRSRPIPTVPRPRNSPPHFNFNMDHHHIPGRNWQLILHGHTLGSPLNSTTGNGVSLEYTHCET